MPLTHEEKLSRDRQRYRETLESSRARGRAFYAANRCKILESQRRRRLTYTREDLDRMAAYQRQWRDTNRDKLKASRRACYARDPDKEKEKQRKRYLRYREKRLREMKESRDARLAKEARQKNQLYVPKAFKGVKPYKARYERRKPSETVVVAEKHEEKREAKREEKGEEKVTQEDNELFTTSLHELITDLFPSILQVFEC